MRSYQCRIDKYFKDGSALTSNHIARTPAAARYAFWLSHSEVLTEYSQCFVYIKSKCLGKVEASHFFGRRRDFEEIRERRGLPNVEQGTKVDVDGKIGVVVGGNMHSNFNVLFNDGRIGNVHPTWQTTYYDADGGIIYEHKKTA